jgi:prepilin-type N-terminal cleavage/methylation domain-containing protein
MRSRTSPGFTLIELITVLVVIGVMVSMAGPAIGAEVQRLRVRSTLDRLTADLYRARLLAVTHAARVSVRFQPSRGCAAAYVLARADSTTLHSVPLPLGPREVCLTSNTPQSMSIDSRGMLIGSPRVIRAQAGAQADSVSVSIAGRVYRWY